MFDVARVRSDFPILGREVNGKPLVYLDNGASAQKPQVVIDAMNQAYSMEYANVHRGLHYLSNLSTDRYEAVRGKIARFLNAGSEDEIVFTSGATEGINLVSYGWAAPRLQPGDDPGGADAVMGVDLDAAVVEEERERVPALEHVEAGLGEVMAARQLADLLGEPGV